MAATALFVAVLTLTLIQVQPTQAFSMGSEITIQPDGSVEGTSKIYVEGNLYTLTSDISGSPQNGACLIAVKKDGVTLDGLGHALVGTGTGAAIELDGRNNVVVKNFVIDNFALGIVVDTDHTPKTSLITSANYQIINNKITSHFDGIQIQGAHNTIKANTVTAPSRSFGINLQNSYNNVVSDNTLFGSGIGLVNQTQTIRGNTVDGKAIVILEDASNQVIDDAGQVLLYSCRNISVKNVNPPSDLKVSVGFYDTDNSRVENCKGNIVLENSEYNTVINNYANSIKLSLSHNNLISQNTITSNVNYGIRLEFSTNNDIDSNTVSVTDQVGIGVASENNKIHGNDVYGCKIGLELSYIKEFVNNPVPPYKPYSANNSIYANKIANCTTGVSLDGARENTVFVNNIVNCTEVAVKVHISDGNTIYHNNFTGNTQSVFEDHSYFQQGIGLHTTYYSANNTWDDGYPSGGNFWSTHVGTDVNGDGIGDTAYLAFENHIDRYPLMKPYTAQNLNTPSQTPSESANEQQPTQKKPEPNTATIIVISAASATLIGAGLLVYFKIPRKLKIKTLSRNAESHNAYKF